MQRMDRGVSLAELLVALIVVGVLITVVAHLIVLAVRVEKDALKLTHARDLQMTPVLDIIATSDCVDPADIRLFERIRGVRMRLCGRVDVLWAAPENTHTWRVTLGSGGDRMVMETLHAIAAAGKSAGWQNAAVWLNTGNCTVRVEDIPYGSRTAIRVIGTCLPVRGPATVLVNNGERPVFMYELYFPEAPEVPIPLPIGPVPGTLVFYLPGDICIPDDRDSCDLSPNARPVAPIWFRGRQLRVHFGIDELRYLVRDRDVRSVVILDRDRDANGYLTLDEQTGGRMIVLPVDAAERMVVGFTLPATGRRGAAGGMLCGEWVGDEWTQRMVCVEREFAFVR